MLGIIWLVLLLACPSVSQEKLQSRAVATPVAEGTVFRDPFTLKLQIDKGHFYEEKFDKIPYVANNEVYLFPGDDFGIDLSVTGEEISGIRYEKNLKKADVTFKFTPRLNGSNLMMMLTIESRLKQRLYLDALMRVPDRKGVYKTSILPIMAGKLGFESWPHPIVQLVLQNLRFAEKPSSQERAEGAESDGATVFR